MSVTSAVPEVGQIVRVRQRLYLVEGLVAPPRPQDSTLVELSCVEDDAQGQSLAVLWERELDAAILTGEEWARIAQRGFDPPEYFSAYLTTLRWNCVTSTDASLFQSPFRAGIRLDAYQLEPLRKALRLPRVNLFIADDVGLGKTIEAGLIARELLMRKKVREIVVACPPSMLLQWREELEQRFGLLFEILDEDFIAQIRRERGFGVNPWTAHSRFLISHRLLIDEAYAGPLRNWLGTFRPGSMLILDEAHHAAPSSGQRYAIDSQITRAQLSWIIADAQHTERFVMMPGTLFDINLDPGEIREVGRQGAAMSLVDQTLDKLGATNGLLKIGVVNVVFENGKEWTYPLALRGKFEENDGAAIAVKYAQKLKEYQESRKGAAGTTKTIGAGCVSTEKLKLIKAAMPLTGGCGSKGFNPWVFICNPWSGTQCISSPTSCDTNICMGYGCTTECCALNICTGQQMCG
jgi:hypothetical protein